MSYQILHCNLTSEEVQSYLDKQKIDYEIWQAQSHEPYDVHKHQYDKTLYIIEGQITFYLGEDEPVTCQPKDILQILQQTWHSAIAGQQGCLVLEIKSLFNLPLK